MKNSLFTLLIYCSALSALGQGKSDSTSWSIPLLNTGAAAAYFGATEKAVLLEINKVRTNPRLYAEFYLQPMLDHFDGKVDTTRNLSTREGSAAVKEAIRTLRETREMDVLVPNQDLYKAARHHTKLQSVTEETGHTSPNGETMEQRLSKFGYMNYAECISYGQSAARWIVVQLLVDDGVPSRGHRKIVLNPVLREVGIAAGGHGTFSNMCTLDFGSVRLTNRRR